jgi:hypothetical protein
VYFEDITGGCFADSSLITIDVTPQPIASLTSDKFAETFCTDEDIILSSTSSVAGSTYEFRVDGVNVSGAASTTPSFTLLSRNDCKFTRCISCSNYSWRM